MVDPSLHVPLAVRRRIGLPVPPDGRAFPMTVRFGMEPIDPLDMPGGYRYEVSAEDRSLFERAMRDTRSDDADRRRQARDAVKSALNSVKGIAPLGTAAYLGGNLGILILDFLGFFARGSVTAGGTEVAYVEDTVSPNRIQTFGLVARASWSVRTDANGALVADASFFVESTVREWSKSEPDALGRRSYYAQGLNGGLYNGAPSSSPALISAGTRGDLAFANSATEPPKSGPEISREPGETRTLGVDPGGSYRFWVRQIEYGPSGDVRRAEHVPVSDVLSLTPGSSFERQDPGFGLDEMDPVAPSPEDYSLTPEEIRDEFMPPLRDSPYNRNYPPDPTRPPVPTTPVTPVPPNPTVPVDDDPLDPNFPCEPPFPGGPAGPTDPNFPSDPPLPTEPTFPGSPTDPTAPVGPGPGDIPGGPSPIENPTFPVPGPIDFDMPGCEPAMPGEPVTASLGGKTVRGKVGRYEPGVGGDPCHFTVPTPPYADENFTAARCYRNKPAVEVARELAVELGMDPATLVTEPGCTARFTGCFEKGSSKFDAMWAMLDLCGYGIFPDPTDPAIGPLTPLPVHHGPYHEDRDVFVFERSYDDLDMPSHVEYFRPNTPTLRGFSVVVPVISPYAVPFDKWDSNLAPASMTEGEALTAATLKAQGLAARGNVANVAVPLKLEIKQRHQVEVRRPILGISFNYMVLSLSHDYEDDGDVSVLECRELGIRTYVPQPGGPGISARGLGA